MPLNLDLPLRPVENIYREIEIVLAQMRDQVEARYSQRIVVLLLTVDEADADDLPLVHRYSVKLDFVRSKVVQSIMEIDCDVSTGYPVKVKSEGHNVSAADRAALEKAITDVFSAPLTRQHILTYY
jgi:hypothetical protein